MRRIPDRPWARELMVIMSLCVLAVWALWPALRTLDSGISPQDPSSAAWHLWWVKEQVLHLRNPWFTDHMFAPDGLRLGGSSLAPLIGLLALPLTLTLGPAETVNLLGVLLPPMAAYAMYRFCLRLGVARLAGFAAGALYGFSPIVIWRSQFHLILGVNLVLFPLQLLFAHRAATSLRRRDAVFLGLALGASVLVDPSSALFGIVLSGTLVLALRRHELRRHGRTLLRLTAFAALGFLALSWPQILSTYFAQSEGVTDTPVSDLAFSWRTYGADLLSIFRPSPDLHLPHAATTALDDVFSLGTGTFNTPGLAFLVLGVAGIVLARRRPLAVWAIVTFAVSVVLALGVRISVGEHLVNLASGWTPAPLQVGGQKLSALLPYSWLVRLPLIENLREAQRFMLLALPAATVLVAYGISALLGRRRGRWLLGAMAVVAVLEMGITTRDRGPLVPLERPQVYAAIERDHSDSLVVDVPFGWYTGFKPVGTTTYTEEPLLRATEHDHPIATGFANRLSNKVLDGLIRHPFYAGLYYHQYAQPAGWPTPTPPPDVTDAQAAQDARNLNVGWAVVRPDAPRTADDYLRRVGFRLRRAVEGFRIYRRTG